MARIYRRTEAGTRALQSALITLAPEMYRVLQVVEVETHLDTVRGRARDLSDEIVSRTLAQLEELGFLRSEDAPSENDLDFTQHFRMPTPAERAKPGPIERERLAKEADTVSGALENRGIFIAEARVRNRPPLRGGPQDHTVLVVEDQEDQAALTRRICERQGFKVHVAADRAAMTRALRDGVRPSLVLLDVMLPDGDGFEILARLRAHRTLALLPVVLITARGDQADVLKGLRLGADAYVVKPFNADALNGVLSAVLPLKPAAIGVGAVQRAGAPVVSPAPPVGKVAPVAAKAVTVAGKVPATLAKTPSIPENAPAAAAKAAAQTSAAAPAATPVRAQQQARTARKALEQRGVYLATRRLKNRNPVAQRGKEISILLVEDDPDQAMLMRRHLEKGGYGVRHVENVAGLTGELKRARPTLVLLDGSLPDGDGFVVLERLRKHPVVGELPIVMLTARSTAREIAQGLALGADGYIIKPYTREVLLDTVSKVLKLGGV